MIPLLVVVCLTPLGWVIAQEAQRPVSNADIVNLTKSGVGEQTIILMIQNGTPKFETSPDAIIGLKKAGVSDAVLNAMLHASSVKVPSADGPRQDCAESLDEALASFGARETLLAVRSIRWSGRQILDSASGRSSASIERVTA